MTIAASTQAKIDKLAADLDTASAGLTADLQALRDQLIAANNGMSAADVENALAPLQARADAFNALATANASGGTV